MPLLIEHEDGQAEFPDETLLIFIDETGHEDLVDSGAPYFGFGGCLSPVPLYTNTIVDPWDVVKKHFPVSERPLHAADLKPDEMKKEQIQAISTFFRNGNFGRFAVVASSKVLNETEQILYHILAIALYKRIIEITKALRGPVDQIVMVFEHSQRTDSLMADYFRRYHFEKSNGSRVPVFYATQTKKDEYMPGLSVADFVAHTAEAEVRSRMNGRTTRRKDFLDVFVNKNPSLSSYLEVTRITNS